jgi:hypothetical protein
MAGIAVSALGISFYPMGHLATSVRLDETYIDFSHYALHAEGLIEIAPQANAAVGLYYQPGEPISPIAWADYTFIESIRIQVGRFPIPFGVFNELANPTNNALVTSPHICTEAIPAPWTDWGARLQWSPNLNNWETMSFSVYLCNGLGYGETMRDSRQLSDNNQSNAFGTRIAIISPRAGEFGASGYFGARDAADSSKLGLVGLDAHSRIGFVELRGEYVAGLLDFHEGAFQAIGEGFDYLADEPDNPVASWTCGAYFQTEFHLSQYAIPAIRLDIIGYEDANTGVRIMQRRLGLGFACYPISPLVLKFEFGLLDDRHEENIQLEPLNLQLGVSL